LPLFDADRETYLADDAYPAAARIAFLMRT